MAMIAIPSYVEILAARSPITVVTALGDGSEYDMLVWQSGAPIPSKAELDVLRLEEAKVRQWRAIQAIRDSLRSGGVQVGQYWFHSDDSSRIQQLGLVMFGQNMPTGIMWKTMSGTFVPMTPSLALQIFTAHATHDTLVFSIAEQKRQAVNALTDITSIAQFDHHTGWPPSYTGAAT